MAGRRKAGLLRLSLLLGGIFIACLGLAACGGDNENPSPSDLVVISGATPRPTPTPELKRFAFPIAGACLPVGDQLMPNAPRPYREGVHEGIDFYEVDNCTAIGEGTEVLAAKAGEVVRADWDYKALTAEELDELNRRVAAQEGGEEVLDRFRGRQVWIDHGDGVVTRYVHLSGIAEGLKVGASVRLGQVIGYVGNSGTPESLSNPAAEMHLHFEIRVGEGYLGQGLPAAEVRALYEKAFAP